MSPQMSIGIKTPVDSLAPYTNANPVTIKIAKPLIPDLAIPNNKAQPIAIKKAKLKTGTAGWKINSKRII